MTNSGTGKNADWLVLVPTEFEREQMDFSTIDSAVIAICGFGPIAAAARTANLLCEFTPSSIMLVGIAGSLSQKIDVGNAYQFRSVYCHGIGIGRSDHHIAASDAGWMQIEGKTNIGDRISLTDFKIGKDSGQESLVTVCAASADELEVQELKQRFPEAVAEDMEAFGVAAAGNLAGVPVTVVRGISNVAGNRDKSDWEFGSAMAAANQLAVDIIREN